MSVLHIIATGESATNWKGEGPSIGVNDAAKWGYELDYLVIVNFPNQFQQSRLQTILGTNVKKVYSSTPFSFSWQRHFHNVEEINTRRYSKGEKLSQNYIYHSETSPFVAMSLGYSQGFTKLVLWGVDMINHHRYGKQSPAHFNEVMMYRSFIQALSLQGVQTYIGSKGTIFDNQLPVWNNSQS